ncbi:hypothetical protein GCM10023085_20750 [Actinomadura viridis]|uniref:DUF3073 domain-containing protein n=1 Tax=Actinomadura viridis TaxID=58110 RepID=A0A931DM55_9ACTN|nr:DUF3073 domain-containing protein [Actinomadura viridis]MBG6089168.1 hypothetical protein [Actinomadura viridis]
MGRGRAKAKQAKVARKLKYSGGGTDLERLRRELGAAGTATADRHTAAEDERYDPHARYDRERAGEPED